MKKLFCLFIGVILTVLFFNSHALAISRNHNIDIGEKVYGTVYHYSGCQPYTNYYYDVSYAEKPSFLSYNTVHVRYIEQQQPFPSCRFEIRYSIEALESAPAGSYTFSVEYKISAGPSGAFIVATVTIDFKIDIASPDISISPTYFLVPLNIMASFESPSIIPRGLAFDGTYLWHADSFADKIYKLNTSGNVITSFDSPYSFSKGLAFDGTYLWHADSSEGKIYQLDTSGTVIASFDSPASSPRGLAFDGTYLWNADWLRRKIYQLDISGTVMTSFDSPGRDPTGLAFDGTHLWHADSYEEKIYQLDTSGNVIAFFDSPGPSPEGLAFDGTYLWHADSSDDKIYKLGFPYVGSITSRTFTVNNDGSVDLEIDTVSLAGTDMSEFYIQNDNCSQHSIAASGTCTFDIQFRPTSEGTKSANLSITSNDPDTPTLTIQLLVPATAIKGDISGDGVVDLGDVILNLQVCAGLNTPLTVNKEADVNGDGKIGTSDAIYIIQMLSGVRQ